MKYKAERKIGLSAFEMFYQMRYWARTFHMNEKEFFSRMDSFPEKSAGKKKFGVRLKTFIEFISLSFVCPTPELDLAVTEYILCRAQ